MGLLDAARSAVRTVGSGINSGLRNIERGAQAVGSAVVQGAQQTGAAISRGAQVTAQFAQDTYQDVRSNVVRGAQVTAQVAQSAYQEVRNDVVRGAQVTAQFAQDTFESARDGVTRGAQRAGELAQDAYVGARDGITAGIQAVNPFRGGGPDKPFDGMFVGANGQTLPRNTPLSQVPAVTPQGGVRNNETLVYVNGIQTDVAAQSNSLQVIANNTGSRVVGIHNSTEGIAADLAQCVGDKADLGTNPAVDTLADTVYNEIRAGRDIHLMAHSQGGLITSRALADVSRRLRLEDGMSRADAEGLLSRVRVETFGGAAGHYPDGPQYAHYVNQADPVPALFGLGSVLDQWNPTIDAGRGAQVNYFTEPHLNPINAHNFDSVYMNRRVPFEQARQGDFTVR